MTDYYYVDYFDEKTMKQKFINIVKEQAGKDQFIEKDFLSIATDPSKLSYRVVLNGVLTFSANVYLSVAWHAVKYELFEKPDRWGGTESGNYTSKVFLLDKGLRGEYEPYKTRGTFYTDKYTREQLAYATNVPEILGFSQSMEKAILADVTSFEDRAMKRVWDKYSGYSITREKPYVRLDGSPSLFGADRYISPTYEISILYKNKKISAWFNKEGQMINVIDYPIEEKERKRREKIQRQQQWRKENRCQYCGGNFTGFFKKTCTNCGVKKDY